MDGHLHKALGGVVVTPRPIEAGLSGVFDDALHEDACGRPLNLFGIFR